MARRKAPDPDAIAPHLDAVRQAAKLVRRRDKAADEARAARDEAIRAALRADEPPTHAQLAEAAGVSRGYIPQA